MQRMDRVVLMLAGLALGGCPIPPRSGQPAENGVSQLTAQPGASTIEIAPSCTGFR